MSDEVEDVTDAEPITLVEDHKGLPTGDDMPEHAEPITPTGDIMPDHAEPING